MKAAHNVLYMKKHTNVRFISCDGHQLYDFKERGVDLEVEGVRYYIDASRAGRIRTGPASFKGRRCRTRGRSQCMPRRLRMYTIIIMSPETHTCEVPSNGVVEISLLPVCTGDTSI